MVLDPNKYETVDSLYKQCIIINKDFEKVDLSTFNCKSQNMNTAYCDDVSKVSTCYDIANSLDTFSKRTENYLIYLNQKTINL